MSIERAASAGAWSALDIFLRQGVQFVVSVILARLLLPADFGLIALLSFFTSLSITVLQGGLTLALIQRQDSSHELENAVFWCNLAASLLLSLILLAIAPAVAGIYEQPILGPLMFVAAGQTLFSALGAVQTALLTRELLFARLTIAGIVSSICSGAAGIAAALSGWGVWALAIQMLTAAATSTAALWLVTSWRPSLAVRWSEIRSLLGFGANVSASSILEVLYSHGFLLVIGKAYSIADLGLWNRAAGVTMLPTTVISQVISRTALPLFAQRQNDTEALCRGFRLAIGVSMVLTLPLIVGLSTLADLLIVGLFGPNWTGAAPLLAVIALSAALLPLQILNLNLLLAAGESNTYLRLEVWKKAFGIAILGVGCLIGLMALAYAAFVASLVSLWINAWPNRKLLGFGPVRQLADLAGVLFCAGAMALIVTVLKANLDLPPWPAIAVLAGAGAVTYGGLGLLLGVRQFREALDLALGLWRNSWERRARREG